MSDSFVSFLASWLRWAENGAPESEPYVRSCGLCFNSGEYDDLHESSVQRELQDALRVDFEDIHHSFDTEASYCKSKRGRTMHQNPSRLAWVRKQLAGVETHRGWPISTNCIGEYVATHPDYDPTPVYADDGPSDNRYVTAGTRAEAIEEIDNWLEENDDV